MAKTTRRRAADRRMRARLRGKLLERRRILLAEMHAATALRGSRETGPISDTYDAATEALDQDMELFLFEIRSCGIDEIDRTLEKIANGTYGICEACEGHIPVARLRALPTASLCVACQREQEKTAAYEPSKDLWERVEDESRDDATVHSAERACQRA